MMDILNDNKLAHETISGIIWKFAERIGAQLVTLVVSIILARILTPDDYGIIAIVTIFISICNTLITYGLGNSLIQKRNADNLDFSSVFYIGIVISLMLYLILFILAPLISGLYKNKLLTPILRIMGLRLPITAINSVQQAYVSRKMIFKKFFFATLIGTISSSYVGLSMAYSGYGVWSLVGQYLTNVCIGTIVLWFTVKWRPDLKFSLTRLKSLLSYGWKLLASGLLDTFYSELRSLVIGIKYTTADLAFYDKGKQFPSLISINVNSSFSAVLFPAMSLVQENSEHLKRMVRKSIRVSSYVLMPCMVGLGCIAPNFVILVLTEKWLPMVPYLRILCFVYAFWPIHTVNLQAIKAAGRSDLILYLEILKKLIGVVLLLISMQFGVIWIAATEMLTTVVGCFINAYPNRVHLDYKYSEQLSDLLPALILSGVMMIPILLVGMIRINLLLLVVLQVIIGIIVYLGSSSYVKNDSFIIIYSYVKKIVCKNNYKK